MNKKKLSKVFDEIKSNAKMDYAITNADEYGDCNTCVNNGLVDAFGLESTGIYTKHWLKGMNKGDAWKHLNYVYIAHDITEEQASIMVGILEQRGYDVEPKQYDATKSFKISEKATESN